MIGVITFILGGVAGFAFGRGRSIVREREIEEELARRSLPPATDQSSALPQDAYRPPDTTAIINLPVDAEDFDQLSEAICTCFAAVKEDKAAGEAVTAADRATPARAAATGPVTATGLP